MLFLMLRRKLLWRKASASPVKDIAAVRRPVFVRKGGIVCKNAARCECSLVNRFENGMVPRWSGNREWETPCQTTRVVARGAWEIREVSGEIINGQAPCRSGAIDETHEPDVFAPWWFLERSKPGRQSLALSGQTK